MQDRYGRSVTQPVSIWNRPLSIEPNGSFLYLAKAAIDGTKLELDGAFENLADAVQGIDAEDESD